MRVPISHVLRPHQRKLPARLLTAAAAAAAATAMTAAPAQAAVNGACSLPRTSLASMGAQPALPNDLSSIGQHGTLILPVDFSDKPGAPGFPTQKRNEWLQSQTLLSKWSSGRLVQQTRTTTTTPDWLRMPQTAEWYDNGGIYQLLDDAMAAALPYLGPDGFTGIETVGIISTDFPGANATKWVRPTPDGKTIKGQLWMGTWVDSGTIAHETLHVYDLPDLYGGSPDSNTNGYDVMGDGGSYSPTPLSASGYKLDWLQSSQVDCLKGTAPLTVSLTPMETLSQSAKKAVFVPINTHKMLTIEARSTVSGAAGCMDGIVISTVDSGIVSASAPVRVQSPNTGNCPALRNGKSAAWGTGSVYTDPETGTKVTVGAKAANGTWTVTVTPKPRYANTVAETAGLLAYWRLGDKTKTSWNGSQPGVQDGRIHNAEGTSSRALMASDSNMIATGIYDQPAGLVGTTDTAQLFNGSRHLSMPAIGLSAQASMEFWTKADANAPTTYVVGSLVTGFRMTMGPTSAVVRVSRDNTPSATVNVTTPDNRNTWVHWALVASSNTLTVYRNGTAVGSAPMTGTGNVVLGNGPLGALDGSTTGRYRGLLDDVAVYNTALSAATVQQHYQRGITP